MKTEFNTCAKIPEVDRQPDLRNVLSMFANANGMLEKNVYEINTGLQSIKSYHEDDESCLSAPEQPETCLIDSFYYELRRMEKLNYALLSATRHISKIV